MNSNIMNYYDILDVPKNTTIEEIKKKYRKLAIQFHPDKNKSVDANEKFKKINEAYKTLSDPYSRGRYDVMLENENYGQMDNLFGMNFNNAMDFFNNIFKNNSFLNDPVFDFRIPNINRDFPSNSSFHSYSSSTFQTRDKNGKIFTTKQININNNGKQESLEEEYCVDRDIGNKKYIKYPQNKLYSKTILKPHIKNK